MFSIKKSIFLNPFALGFSFLCASILGISRSTLAQGLIWAEVPGTDTPSAMIPNPDPALVAINNIERNGEQIIFDSYVDEQYLNYEGNCESSFLRLLATGSLDNEGQPINISPYPVEDWFEANIFQFKILSFACSYSN